MTNELIPSTVANTQITRDNPFAAQAAALPARQQVELYMPGTVLNDTIVVQDKPAGIEPGQLFIARDKSYYQALNDIAQNLDFNIHDISKNYDTAFKKVYKAYQEKEKWENNNENIMSYSEYVNNHLVNAKKVFDQVVSSDDPVRRCNLLEECFNQNPIMFQIFYEKIRSRNQSNENDVLTRYVKLDFQDPDGFINNVAPSVRRVMSTKTAKDVYDNTYKEAFPKAYLECFEKNIKEYSRKMESKLKQKNLEPFNPVYLRELVEDFHVPAAALAKDQAHEIAHKAAWEAQYSKAKWNRLKRWGAKGSIEEQSIGSVEEVIATNDAKYANLKTQTIETMMGAYEKLPDTPKIMVTGIWEKSFATFKDLVDEPENSLGLAFSYSGGMPGPTRMSDSNYFCYKDPNSDQLYSASHLVNNVGMHLALFLKQSDRDCFGKQGQNKGVIINDDGSMDLFGIDFGHAYEENMIFSSNQIVKSVKDDFSFTQPHGSDEFNLVNYAMLYDDNYDIKMEGMHIIAKQCGEKMLGELGINIPKETKDSFGSIWNEKNVEAGSATKAFDEQILAWDNKRILAKRFEENCILIDNYKKKKSGSDPKLIEKINKSIEIINQKQQNIAKQLNVTSLDKSKAVSMQNKISNIINAIEEKKQCAVNNNTALLRAFSNRLLLTREEVNCLDNLEKLLSNAKGTSLDGKVILNHLHVIPSQRVAVQFDMENGKPKVVNGSLILTISDPSKAKTISNYLGQNNNLVSIKDNKIMVKQERFKEFAVLLAEENVAKYLGQQIQLGKKPGQNADNEDSLEAIPISGIPKINADGTLAATPVALSKSMPEQSKQNSNDTRRIVTSQFHSQQPVISEKSFNNDNEPKPSSPSRGRKKT